MKKSNSKGITLISLVITIVLMLIIAGVVVSNVVGNNSSIKNAEKAKISAEERSKKELLNQALIKYNSGNAIGSENLKDYLIKELEIKPEDLLQVWNEDGEEAYIIKDFLGEKVYLSQLDGIWEINLFGAKSMDFGNLDKLEDGDRLIALKDGVELDIEKNNYAIITKDDLKEISFDIPAHTNVKIKLLSDFTITNQGLQRAAINLNEGSVLDLAIYGNVTVNSTYGENGAVSNAKQVQSKGGYAGIRVPKFEKESDTATLNLSGTGTITCYGGSAGKGGTFNGTGDSGGSGGGRSWCWNWWKWWLWWCRKIWYIK